MGSILMDNDDKTSSPNFCLGRDCPEIVRLKAKIDKIYAKLDLILGGIITVLVTVIGGLLT